MKFYEWSEALPRHALPEGPVIWICGDCHSGIGLIANIKGPVIPLACSPLRNANSKASEQMLKCQYFYLAASAQNYWARFRRYHV